MRVELLRSPGCRNADGTHAMLRNCLAECGVRDPILELVGPFASPTVLINGLDVVGEPPGGHIRESCRLDLPTADHVRSAVRAALETPT